MKNSADLGGCYPPRPSASVDNTLLDLQNSSYPTQPHSTIANYNIASRAAQSNSVYVSVLKIAIVLADGVSKFFFSREWPLSALGKILYFATIMDTNRLNPLVAKRRQFSWARV